MKVYVTSRPEDAARCLAGNLRSVVVRRQRFWRPVIWFRPNLLKDLDCWWHWDSSYRSSQLPQWEHGGGILFHYPSMTNDRGIECDAHYHEQCPTSVRLFAVHTAFTKHTAVIPVPTSWDHLRKSIALRFPNRLVLEPAYDRIRAQRCDLSDVRCTAACRECEADPKNSAVFTGDQIGELVGLGRRDAAGIVSALFGFRSPKAIFPILPRIRPAIYDPARDLFEFIEREPELPNGWRIVKAGRLFEQTPRYRAILRYLLREGYILRDAALYVFDFDAMNPDFGRADEISREKARLLEAMIRFVESLPALPL